METISCINSTRPTGISIKERKLLLQTADLIVVHSGNILHELLTSPEEVCKSFCGVVKLWMEDKSSSISEEDTVGDAKRLSITSSPSSLDAQEGRDKLKITVKLFLLGYYPEIVEEAVFKAIKDLHYERLDTLVLSLPPLSSAGKDSFNSVKYEAIKDIWSSLQNLVNQGIVSRLGVCDFDLESLKDLHQSSQVKPVINQIHLKHSCTLSKELLSWAAANNVDLLTHNDPNEILPENVVAEVLPEEVLHGKSWTPAYVIKYSTVVKYREVVRSKGYILCMKQNAES